jgi:regulator of sigma E protease
MNLMNLIEITFLKKDIYLSFSLIGLSFLVLIHELGHFLACKICKIPAHIFSIGFGPVLIKKKLWGTEFKISAIPLGGYVAIGEKPLEENETEVNILQKSPLSHGILVLFGGIFLNLMFVFIASIALVLNNTLHTGITKNFISLPQITSIETPEQNCTLKLEKQDYILAINGKLIDSGYMAMKNLALVRNNPIEVQVSRDGEIKVFTMESNDLPKNTKIEWETPYYAHLSISDKISFAISAAQEIIKQTIKGILEIFNKDNLKKISSFVGILSGGSQEAQKSFSGLIAFLIILSANLAILNLLPLPIFDGGQFVLLLIEKIIGKPLPEKSQIIIAYASWGFVILLTLLATYNDILTIFFKK